MKFIMISFCCIVTTVALLATEALGLSCSRDDPEKVKGHLSNLKNSMIEKFKTFIIMAENVEVDIEDLSVEILSEVENLINEFKSCQFDFVYGRLLESYKHSSDSSAKLERYKRIRRHPLSKQESAESSEVSRTENVTPISQDEETVLVDDSLVSGVTQEHVDYLLSGGDYADHLTETVVDHVLSSSPTLETVADHVQDSSEGSVEQVLDFSDEIEFLKRAGIIRGPLPPRSISEIRRKYFPDYKSIPETGFTCVGKNYIPGFYADMETDCQVFHVCWPRRKESYLCPMASIFNQKKLTCDIFVNSDCSLSPLYYQYNEKLHAMNKPEWLFEYDDTVSDEMRDPEYDLFRYEHTLLLPRQSLKIIPIAYNTTFYPEVLHHSDNPKFEEYFRGKSKDSS